MDTRDFPLGLRQAIESGRCVLFLGAGCNQHMKSMDGVVAPDGYQLASELVKQFSVEAEEPFELAKVAQIVELKHGRKELEAFLRKRLANLQPDKYLQWLFSLRWKSIYTTNYDSSILRAYELNSAPLQNPVPCSISGDLVDYDPRFQVPVFFIHGALYVEKPNIVITEKDYLVFRERRKMLFELLKLDTATSCILYIGYSHKDPNWKLVINELQQEFQPNPIPSSYRISPSTPPMEIELLRATGVETVTGSLKDFVECAKLALNESSLDQDQLERLGKTIPEDLAVAFESNPAAVARLLASWEYVNQASFSDKPNVHAFLRGDHANWALIGNDGHFHRDIEAELYEELLDYATGIPKKVSADILLAPAGYGITTILMSMAVQLVKERAGPVFFLKEGVNLIEGDVEFAISLFANRPFFFVDNAGDHRGGVAQSLQRLRDKKLGAMFVLGERLNEWRQGGARLGKEFGVDILSDAEINRLLDCLEKHSELGKLQELKREFQIAAIRNNHSKELLVTMRETTEGLAFDAILENEYRGINNPNAKHLYLVVCCFYQLGIMIRAEILAELMKCNIVKMYEIAEASTDGVVIFECIDNRQGIYAGRARHRKIAEVVWNRCGEQADKERILQDGLAKLNLTFKTDRDAFDQFVRNDILIDSISTFDGKTRFFETACKKDPQNAYVHQHYARMLSREGKYTLALDQIERAISINPDIRVLYHTKGKILSEMAINSEGMDIGRKRLAQSEACYKFGQNINPKDSYCYQGLAELYFDWAKRCDSDIEASQYIEKAESIITNALRVVRDKEGLWILSAAISNWLGNSPKHIQALERAVKEAPSGILGRYLLGREYRKLGKLEDAQKILEPVIRNHTEEFRSCIEYARVLLEQGEPYSKAIAILKLSTLYGFTDPEFIAMLGGLLFLTGVLTEAQKVFDESASLALQERQKILFKPHKPHSSTDPLKMYGKIVGIKPGYMFIDVQDFPQQIFCPANCWNGIIPERNLAIEIELVFSARGPLAINLTKILNL